MHNFYTVRHEVAHVLGLKLLCNMSATEMKVTKDNRAVVKVDNECNFINYFNGEYEFDGVFLRNFAAQSIMGPIADHPDYFAAWMNWIKTNQLSAQHSSDWVNIQTVATLFSINAGEVTADLNTTVPALIGSKFKTEGYCIDLIENDKDAALNTLHRVVTTAYDDATHFITQYKNELDTIATNIVKQFGNSFKLNQRQIEFQLRKVNI